MAAMGRLEFERLDGLCGLALTVRSSLYYLILPYYGRTRRRRWVMGIVVPKSKANWVKIHPSDVSLFYSGSRRTCIAIDLVHQS